jgi:hypothetical protein
MKHGYIAGGHYFSEQTGAFEKINDVGMVGLFSVKEKPGWLPCNGSVINKTKNGDYYLLVNLLRDEVVSDCSRVVEITFTKNGDQLHPGSDPSFYWIFSGPNNEKYCIWYSVEHTGKEPAVDETKINVNVPLLRNRGVIGAVATTTARVIRSSIEGVTAERFENTIRIASECYCPVIDHPKEGNDSGIEIYMIQRGSDFRSHSYYHKNTDSCKIPKVKRSYGLYPLIRYA